MQNYQILGELSRLGGQQMFIVADAGEKFFCQDPEKFATLEASLRLRQRIERVINRTFFYTGGALMLYAYTPEQKTLLSALQEQEVDTSLAALVSLCEGADGSDIEKFRFCSRIELFRELPEMGSHMPAGLGFAGKGLGLVVAHFDSPFQAGRRVFLQIVNSYPEGYAVEHQHLTRELFAFAHLDGIKEILFR